jgi:hypothetical protein
MSVKRDSFKNDNVFMLAGHGAEVLDRDLERYILGKNEYLAMYHIPGDVGVLGDISFYNNFYNDKRIDIPTAKDKYLVSKDYFGSIGGLKRAQLSDMNKMAIVNTVADLIHSYTLGLVYYSKPIYIKSFENFKLYHPRENNEELNYKNTTPNLIYHPGTYFFSMVLDNWVKEHYGLETDPMFQGLGKKAISFKGDSKNSELGRLKQKINNMESIGVRKALKQQKPTERTHINLKYKNVIYSQILYDLGVMTLMKSGIMRKSLSPPKFKKTDIENYDEAFAKIPEHGLRLFAPLPQPFDGVNDGVVSIFFPKNAISKTLGEIINNKDKDPLSYDFLCWYKAAYSESILTFDDICLYAIAKITVNSKSQPSRFKKFYNTIKTLPILISEWIPFKRFLGAGLRSTIEMISQSIPSILHFIESYIKKDLKPMYYSMTEIGNIFLDMKSKFDDNTIKSMSLALTMQDVLKVDMNIETVYKFINLHGKINGEPFMIVPLICRAPMGDTYLIEEKIKLSRPHSKTVKTKTKTKTKTRSKTKSLLKSLTRH